MGKGHETISFRELGGQRQRSQEAEATFERLAETSFSLDHWVK